MLKQSGNAGPASTADTGSFFDSVDVVLNAAVAGETLQLPEDGALLRASFVRVGGDLVLEMPNGTSVLVQGYFDLAEPPALMTAGGALMPADLVSSLAGPLAPGQYAQSGESDLEATPIGLVDESVGEVTATRADGTRVALTQDTPVYQGDVIETADDAALSITFIDETAFSLGEDARMVLDEMIFDPDTMEGSSTFSVVQGVFMFVSGEIAANNPDEMIVRTPVATIGIRGTQVGGQAAQEGETNTIILFPKEDDPTQPSGAVTYQTIGAEAEGAAPMVLDQPYQGASVASIFDTPSYVEVEVSNVASMFGQVSNALPSSTMLQQVRDAAESEEEAYIDEGHDAQAAAEGLSDIAPGAGGGADDGEGGQEGDTPAVTTDALVGEILSDLGLGQVDGPAEAETPPEVTVVEAPAPVAAPPIVQQAATPETVPVETTATETVETNPFRFTLQNADVTPFEVALTTTFTAAGNQGVRALYQLDLDPGQSASLLWYNGLAEAGGGSAGLPLATALSNIGEGSDFLAGLSEAELERIVNYDFGGFAASPGGSKTQPQSFDPDEDFPSIDQLATGGGSWQGFGNESDSGFIVTDANFDGEFDAYDDAGSILVNGTAYQADSSTIQTDGVVDASGDAGGLSVTTEWMFFEDSPVWRTFATFTNNGPTATSNVITWQNNSGADGNLSVLTSGDGDDQFETTDGFVIITDGFQSGDPTTIFTLFGGSSPAEEVSEPAQLIHAYELNGSTADEFGGPSMVLPDVEGLGFSGYAFGDSDGPSLTGAIDPFEYSIEMFFSIEDTFGFKKLIDFNQLSADSGLYSLDQNLNFYPVVTGDGDVIQADELTHVVVTRDGETDEFTGYVNGVEEISFIDTQELAVFDTPGNVINFLIDDNPTEKTEDSAGFLDFVHIYDGVLSASEVETLSNDTFENLVFDDGGIGLDGEGGEGAGPIVGTENDDQLAGGSGNDIIQGGDGGDLLIGNGGDDFLLGQNGNDVLQGNDGNDELVGGDNSDALLGGAGDDLLNGGAGDDFLQGGTGIDQLIGGAGADRFILGELTEGVPAFDELVGVQGNAVLDFESGVDKLVIGVNSGTFGELDGPVQLNVNFFEVADFDGTNSGGETGQAFLVFDPNSNTLYHDDSSASEGYTALFTVQDGASVAASDVELAVAN